MKLSNSQKLVIIIMGPPGSGKGTQAELLAEKLNLFYLETSRVLEKKFREAKKGKTIVVKGKKYFPWKEKKLWEKGILCSPPFVTYLIKNEIKELFTANKNLVLAGSPRTNYEGKEIIPLLKKLYGVKNIKIILLNITPQETIRRNSQRRICQLMRHPVLSTQKKFRLLTHCPLNGSKLIRRQGLDDPESIKVRLKEYKQRTLPLIDYFRNQGLKVKEIDGSLAPAEVFENILKNLNS